MPKDRNFSRRELFKRAGLAGTAAVLPIPLIPDAISAAPADLATDAPAPPQDATATRTSREAFETLTAAESDTLEAIVDRLIPADGLGPGAAQARAAHYIDRALGGALSATRPAYTSGLAAVNAYAQTRKGMPFAKLTAADQDSVLQDIEKDVATGFSPRASTFFNTVRAHTIEGTFSDPYYGGNADFIGWDLIRYPGVRIAVSPAEQQLQPIAPNHRSAYDFVMFSKSKPVASAASQNQDHDHGN